jgi:hypothetical protein
MQDIHEEIRCGGQEGSATQAQMSSDAAERHSRPRKKGPCRSPGGRVDGGSRFEPTPRSRVSREMTLEIAAQEYVWLWDRRHGSSIEAIAAREGVSIARVRFGVARARAQQKGAASSMTTPAIRPPRLVPLFPIAAYTPQSSCAHRRAIEAGSSLCCMVCHTSGMDRHPALRRDPRTDPAPEPKPKAETQQAQCQRETRRERRQRLFAARS